MNILDKIAESRKANIKLAKEKLSFAKLTELAENSRQPFDFLQQFQNKEINIISEIKFASPSEGNIAKAEPVNVAEQYLNNGSKALSILTEPDYFKGDINYISEVRERFPSAKILMKDFVIDEYQLLQAKAFGADAVLLIVALLGEKLTKEFIEKIFSLGLTPLVEVHNSEEMKIALDSRAKLIGVNNRNLKDMGISLKTSEELAVLSTKDITLISESGLKTRKDLLHLQSFGYKGFLIGTAFMKSGNPGIALAEILGRNHES